MEALPEALQAVVPDQKSYSAMDPAYYSDRLELWVLGLRYQVKLLQVLCTGIISITRKEVLTFALITRVKVRARAEGKNSDVSPPPLKNNIPPINIDIELWHFHSSFQDP